MAFSELFHFYSRIHTNPRIGILSDVTLCGISDSQSLLLITAPQARHCQWWILLREQWIMSATAWGRNPVWMLARGRESSQVKSLTIINDLHFYPTCAPSRLVSHPLLVLKSQYLNSKLESRSGIQKKSLTCKTWFVSTTLAMWFNS